MSNSLTCSRFRLLDPEAGGAVDDPRKAVRDRLGRPLVPTSTPPPCARSPGITADRGAHDRHSFDEGLERRQGHPLDRRADQHHVEGVHEPSGVIARPRPAHDASSPSWSASAAKRSLLARRRPRCRGSLRCPVTEPSERSQRQVVAFLRPQSRHHPDHRAVDRQAELGPRRVAGERVAEVARRSATTRQLARMAPQRPTSRPEISSETQTTRMRGWARSSSGNPSSSRASDPRRTDAHARSAVARVIRAKQRAPHAAAPLVRVDDRRRADDRERPGELARRNSRFRRSSTVTWHAHGRGRPARAGRSSASRRGAGRIGRDRARRPPRRRSARPPRHVRLSMRTATCRGGPATHRADATRAWPAIRRWLGRLPLARTQCSCAPRSGVPARARPA